MVALVPSGEQMLWQNPVDMCAVAMGQDMAEKKLATVVKVEASVVIEDGPGNGVLGRTTQYERRIGDCTRSKLKDRGETVGPSVIGRPGRPKKAIQHNQHRGDKTDVLVFNLQLPGISHQLHLDRPECKESVSSPWVVHPDARYLDNNRHGKKTNLRPYIADGRILPQYNVVPLEKIPARVLK